MSDYSISCILIVTAEFQATGNLFGSILGFGPDSYCVELSNVNDTSIITHYASHSWVKPDFVKLLEDCQIGILPREIEQAGIAIEQVQSFLNVLIISCKTDIEPFQHFAEILVAHDLIRYGSM